MKKVISKKIKRFLRERERLNKQVMDLASNQMKKFYSLDTQAYLDGALPKKTKELIGLVASLVLRCDDCVTYHLIRCCEEGVSAAELEEAMNIGLVIGGSIAIPHLRRAVDVWIELRKSER